MATNPTISVPRATSAMEVSTLTKMQKLAALLVMMGQESAAQLLKGFPPHDVEALCAEMSKLEIVPQELQRLILEEFTSVAVEAGTSVRGGLEFTRTSLEKAIGPFKANEVINRVAPTSAPVAAVDGIADMEARQLYNLVCHEQPQTIALVLSCLSAERAAELSGLFPIDLRDQVIERLATLAPIPVEVVEKVVEVLRTKAGVRHTRALNQTGGVKTAANILNAMDKSHSKMLLQNLGKHSPGLSKAIQKKMFLFEDLKNMEVSTLQRVLRDVDMRDLALALKTASEKLRALILSSISKRAAEGVREEMAFMAAVKPRDVEAAQQRIVDAARAEEEEEEEVEEGEEGAAASETQPEVQHVTA